MSIGHTKKITRPEEFKRCYYKGSKYLTEHFIIYIFNRPHDHLGPRLGITVTKKVGKAVIRNRIKRLIREAFRLEVLDHKKQDIDIVVVAKKGIDPSKLNLAVTKTELTTIWEHIGKAQNPN